MGGVLSMMDNYEEVPEDVKAKIEPAVYTSCSPEKYETGKTTCGFCTEPLTWMFNPMVNCDMCGLQFCSRCCPKRFLFSGKPGCQVCISNTLKERRDAMLRKHVRGVENARKNEERDGEEEEEEGESKQEREEEEKLHLQRVQKQKQRQQEFLAAQSAAQAVKQA